jgi:hypothetical protein
MSAPHCLPLPLCLLQLGLADRAGSLGGASPSAGPRSLTGNLSSRPSHLALGSPRSASSPSHQVPSPAGLTGQQAGPGLSGHSPRGPGGRSGGGAGPAEGLGFEMEVEEGTSWGAAWPRGAQDPACLPTLCLPACSSGALLACSSSALLACLRAAAGELDHALLLSNGGALSNGGVLSTGGAATLSDPQASKGRQAPHLALLCLVPVAS